MYTWIGIQHVEVHEAENIEAGHYAETAGYVHCRVVHRAARRAEYVALASLQQREEL